jgi:hypothetical protein|tara:strand:+ start:379 stop:753 length:375 start_codon:yes stop_codon:yes gene_type:complete
MTMSDSEIKISKICDDIKELLIHKNRKYGNSALKPCRVFSKSSPVEQLLVRIDDKLNRIMQGAGLLANDEDVVNDLIGYLVLLKIGMHEEKMKNLTQVFHEGFKNVTIPTSHLKNIPQEDDNGV